MNNEMQRAMNDQFKAILELDLEVIKSKLMDSEGQGWSREQAEECEMEYKRFLCLAVTYPEAELVPSVEADTFWHTHILDTRKYAEDCQKAFGFFMHHTPHYGPHGEADVLKMGQAFARTQQLAAELFGSLGDAQPAWSVRAEGQSEKQAAWSVRAEGQSEKQAAWSVRAEGQSEKQAAWSVRAQGLPEKQPAWSVRAEQSVERPAAIS